MFEFLQWALSDFWRFIGTAMLLGIVVQGVVALAAVLMRRP